MPDRFFSILSLSLHFYIQMIQKKTSFDHNLVMETGPQSTEYFDRLLFKETCSHDFLFRYFRQKAIIPTEMIESATVEGSGTGLIETFPLIDAEPKAGLNLILSGAPLSVMISVFDAPCEARMFK
jgi:hypothetical protein